MTDNTQVESIQYELAENNKIKAIQIISGTREDEYSIDFLMVQRDRIKQDIETLNKRLYEINNLIVEASKLNIIKADEITDIVAEKTAYDAEKG